MESYRYEPITDTYCAVIFRNNKNGKLGIVCNIHDEQFIREYWLENEYPAYSVLEVKPIKNLAAFKYYQYWEQVPKAYKTESQRRKKFDFYKYVCGCDLSDKYRGKENIYEVEDIKVENCFSNKDTTGN